MGAAESSLKCPLDFDNLNLYEVLGVSKDASEDDIKQAYRRRALETHPDKNIHDREGATKRFAKVLEAYETLRDRTSRTAYDYDRENGHLSEPNTTDSMPGQWGTRPQNRQSLLGGLLDWLWSWFEWLFSIWRENLFLRYIPETYIARNKDLRRPEGISSKDILEYIARCGEKSTWEENGRDPSQFTLIRNLFLCLAYDERRWGTRLRFLILVVVTLRGSGVHMMITCMSNNMCKISISIG